MKAFACVLVLTVVFVASACGGDEDITNRNLAGVPDNTQSRGNPLGNSNPFGVMMSEQGAYHDAIDLTPAIDPAVRNAAYLAVAQALAGPYLPTPNRDVTFKIIWVASDGVANILISGIFPDTTGEGEKETDFRIRQTASGYWILGDSIDLVFTGRELSHRRDLELLAEYQGVVDLLGQLSATLILAESFVDSPSSNNNKLVRRFEIELGNSAPKAHSVRYTLTWDENSADPRCVNSDEKSDSHFVEAGSTITIEVVELSRIGLGFSGKCQDVLLSNALVTVSGVDIYKKDHVEEQLQQLQARTSSY